MQITDIHEMDGTLVQELTNDFIKSTIWDWNAVRALGATFNGEHFGMTIFAPFIIAWDQDLSPEAEALGIPLEERDLIPTIIIEPDTAIDQLNNEGIYFTIAVCAVSDAIHADDANGDYEISILEPDAGENYPSLVDEYFTLFSNDQDWQLVEEILGGDNEDTLAFLDDEPRQRPTPPTAPTPAIEDFSIPQQTPIETFDFDPPTRRRPVFGE